MLILQAPKDLMLLFYLLDVSISSLHYKVLWFQKLNMRLEENRKIIGINKHFNVAYYRCGISSHLWWGDFFPMASKVPPGASPVGRVEMRAGDAGRLK